MSIYCNKLKGLPCCEGSHTCQMEKTQYCCWHEDKRTNKNMFYLDLYGWIDPSYYGITIPVDLYYCPSCKVTDKHAGDIIDAMKKVMEPPDKYKERITLEKEKGIKIYKKKVNIITKKIEKEKEKMNIAEHKLFCEKYKIAQYKYI